MSKHTILVLLSATMIIVSPIVTFEVAYAGQSTGSPLPKTDPYEVVLELPAVTVGALKNADIGKTSQPVNKIGFGDALKTGGAGLEKIFEDQPSIFVQTGGDRGSAASVTVDGGTSAQTLFLIDGRPVNSPSLGTFNIGIIDRGAFSGAEIVRGPAAPANGPYGLAGTINLEQGQDRDESRRHEIEFAATRSSLHEFSKAITCSGDGTGRADYRLFFKKENSRGSRPNSDFTGDHAAFSDRIKLNDRFTFYISSYFAATENGVPGVRPAPGTAGKYSCDESASLYDRQSDTLALCNADLIYDVSARSKISLKRYRDTHHNYFRSYYDDFFTKSAIAFSGDYQTVSDGSSLNFSAARGRNSFGAGVSRIENRLFGSNGTYDAGSSKSTSVTYAPSSAINSQWVSASAGMTEGLTLTAGLSRDNPDSFETADSYGFGLKKESGKNSTFAFYQGKGYRAPTLNEQYYPGSGNTHLSPERSIFRNFEYSKKMNYGTRLFTGVFTRKTEDLIEWYPDPKDPSGFSWIPQNINSFSARGLQAGIEKRFKNKITAKLFVQTARYRQINVEETYNDFMTGIRKTAAVERDARQMPSRKMVLTLSAPAFGRGGNIRLKAIRTSKMVFYYSDYSAAPAVSMREKMIGANTVFDIQASKKINGSSTLLLSVNNVFNEKYARVFGGSYDDGNFPAPGRNHSLTFISKF